MRGGLTDILQSAEPHRKSKGTVLGDPQREQLKVQKRRGILVAVVPPDAAIPRENALDELRGLVKTAGVDVVDEMIQVRVKPHVAHCIGQGKLEELKQLIKSRDAELVIFDNNLTPAQGKRIEEETKRKAEEEKEKEK